MAPLLWPATGVSISEQGEKGPYAVGVRQYEMPMHGVARFPSWRVLQTRSSPESGVALLELTESETSLEPYPFAFSLQVEYRLDRYGLQLEYRVAASAAIAATVHVGLTGENENLHRLGAGPGWLIGAGGAQPE